VVVALIFTGHADLGPVRTSALRRVAPRDAGRAPSPSDEENSKVGLV